VSIGLPAFNAERFIAESLQSLLAQDYPNLEIVISDNASTDRTEQICRNAAAADGRIRYVRSPVNRGSIANFNAVLGLSTGTYFMWSGDHDLWHPTLISRAVAMLQADPGAVLVYARCVLIDQRGQNIELMDDQVDMSSPSALRRYKRLIWELTVCNMVYGVARRNALIAAGGFGAAFAPDHNLLARLALAGRIERIPEPLFFRRQNRPEETDAEHLERVLNDLDPATAAHQRSRPPGELFKEMRDTHLSIVRTSDLTISAKINAYLSTLLCFRQRFGVSGPVLSAAARASRVIPKRNGWMRLMGISAPGPRLP
jgi:glycosyltransferase involved in cell wall biosynthesis